MFSEDDIVDFALQFINFLESMSDEKVIIQLQKIENQFMIESLVIPEFQFKQCYELRCIPKMFENKIDDFQRLMLPFYQGSIQSNDPIWNQLDIKKLNTNELYAAYQICIKEAHKIMQKLSSSKLMNQVRVIDLLTRRNKKDAKLEKKQEIYQIEQEGVTIIKDENLYCVCRQKFKEGQRMICCEICGEWFHFECVGLKCNFFEAEKIEFYCFICFEIVQQKKLRKKIKRNYEKFFMDPKFILQKELAHECNLDEIIRERLQNKDNLQSISLDLDIEVLSDEPNIENPNSLIKPEQIVDQNVISE